MPVITFVCAFLKSERTAAYQHSTCGFMIALQLHRCFRGFSNFRVVAHVGVSLEEGFTIIAWPVWGLLLLIGASLTNL